MKQILYLTIAVMIAITACKQKTATVDLQAEADTLRNLEDQWVLINQTRDVEKEMGILSSEFVLMPPNVSLCEGLDSLRKKITAMFADTTVLWETYSWTSDDIEISASGDLAFIRGTSRYNVKTPAGIIAYEEKGVDIWKKENGKWKAALSIWNSNKPALGQ